ncbi:MAG: hypothetical protein GDA49_07085 [Rhodospirillales bacterium]|nr:hypothetical protein [Rhodospirillales bacterium]
MTELVAANPDLSHPGKHDRVIPETGALFAAVRSCAPDARTTIIDKPETDIAATRAPGMDAILLGTAPGAEVAAVANLVRSSSRTQCIFTRSD